MSECVVRMEMPINCLECPMYDWNRQKLCCNAHFDLRQIPNGGVPKPDWCPIICQLPEGHGRLVDMNDVEGMFEAAQIISDDDCNCGYVTDDLRIEELPTIVPAERS